MGYFCQGGGCPRVAAGSSCPRLGGHRQTHFGEGSRCWAGGAELQPGLSGQRSGSFKGILQREPKLECSLGPAPHPGGQHRPAEEPAGSPKKSVTCFNFGIRQEEDGFVSSATPFQLFPERQRLEDVAGPNYNKCEPAPAALPSFAPAVGTVSSPRALHLMEGFPLGGGLVARTSVLWMVLHKARLRTGVSAPAGVFPGWVRAGARAARLQSQGVGVMGSRNAGQSHGGPLGTCSQAALLLRASAIPICRR